MKVINKLISGVYVEAFYDDTSIPKVDVDWFFSYLSSLLSGDNWASEAMMFQVGMMLVKLEESDEKMEILEPDMISFPISFVRGITRTLQILRQQKDTYESLEINAEISFPSLRQYVTQCLEWEDTHSYSLERDEPIDNDSGWHIECQNPEHDHEDETNLKRISIYDIALHYHELVPFLALPSGTAVLLENNHPYIFFSGVEKLPKAGSFLSRTIMK